MGDRSGSGAVTPQRGRWAGQTYYGLPQLKPAPFNAGIVGGYIFLAGLSGASAILAAIADQGRGGGTAKVAGHGRALSLLAPTVGAGLLIADLHTPNRFYNMLRVAKATSPMSIGTWILLNFGVFSGLSAALSWAGRHAPRRRWTRRAARAAQLPAAVAGAGLATYTASLLSATSTPLWAAAPAALAVRFAASSAASGAAALSLGQRKSGGTRAALDRLLATSLGVELAATVAAHRTYRAHGVSAALDGRGGTADRLGGTGLGVLLPLGLHAAAAALPPGGHTARLVADTAAVAALAGGLIMRIATLQAGMESARHPETSLRFAEFERP